MFFDNLGQPPAPLPSRPGMEALIRACASIIRLKWLFSEIVATPRCKRAPTPLGNRISPRPALSKGCFARKLLSTEKLKTPTFDSQLSDCPARNSSLSLSRAEREREEEGKRRIDLRSFEYIKRETKLEKLIKHHRYRENVTSSNVTNSPRIDPGRQGYQAIL